MEHDGRNSQPVSERATAPAERWAGVQTPTLVLDGGSVPWLSQGVRALVDVLPNAQLRTLPGLGHDLPMSVLVAEVSDFLAAQGPR